MKRFARILFSALFTSLFFAGNILSGGEYEKRIADAEKEPSLEKRLELWLKASEATDSEKEKFQLYEKGFSLARKINHADFLASFAERLLKSPLATSALKASATFEYLSALKKTGNPVSVKQWESFLALPGIDKKNEFAAMGYLADVCHKENLWYKEIGILKKMLDHPCASDFKKQDILINLSQVYLDMNRTDEAAGCLKTMLKMKSLSPNRRSKANLLLGDAILHGYGWYSVPSPEQYRKMKEYYLQAMKVKSGVHYSAALTRLLKAAFQLRHDNEVISLSKKHLAHNKKLQLPAWLSIKTYETLVLMRQERFTEAIEILEQLYKYRYSLADTCMSLGRAYYRTGDYNASLGMYDEAKSALRGVDDARPAQCEQWSRRLKTMIGLKKQLDSLYLARAKRLNAEAKAAGKTPAAGAEEIDRLRPFQKKKKKEPMSLEEINREEEQDLLEEGLDL